MSTVASNRQTEYVALTREERDKYLSRLRDLFSNDFPTELETYFKAQMKALGKAFYINEAHFTSDYTKQYRAVANSLKPQTNFESLEHGESITLEGDDATVTLTQNKISLALKPGQQAQIKHLSKMAFNITTNKNMMEEGITLGGSQYEKAILQLSIAHINEMNRANANANANGSVIKIHNPLPEQELAQARTDFQNYINGTAATEQVVKTAPTKVIPPKQKTTPSPKRQKQPSYPWSKPSFGLPSAPSLSSKFKKAATVGALVLVTATASYAAAPFIFNMLSNITDNGAKTAPESTAPITTATAETAAGVEWAQPLLNTRLDINSPDGFAHTSRGGPSTSPYGMRTHPIRGKPELHKGTDFEAHTGDPVFTIANGVVTDTKTPEQSGGYGNIIYIRHDLGDEGFLETRYAHLDGINVQKGDIITAGDMIGTAGATGGVTGAHLHLEVRLNGVPRDPSEYLPNSRPPAPTKSPEPIVTARYGGSQYVFQTP